MTEFYFSLIIVVLSSITITICIGLWCERCKQEREKVRQVTYEGQDILLWLLLRDDGWYVIGYNITKNQWTGRIKCKDYKAANKKFKAFIRRMK